MTTRAEISPLFTDVRLSADDVTAIAAALDDVAKTDGQHADEIEMIQGLLQALDTDLGAEKPTVLPGMSPQKLALAITDPVTRKVAVECAVLLAWADGAFSDKERSRIVEYASALGFDQKEYAAIETAITGWVKSGDPAPLF